MVQTIGQLSLSLDDLLNVERFSPSSLKDRVLRFTKRAREELRDKTNYWANTLWKIYYDETLKALKANDQEDRERLKYISLEHLASDLDDLKSKNFKPMLVVVAVYS